MSETKSGLAEALHRLTMASIMRSAAAKIHESKARRYGCCEAIVVVGVKVTDEIDGLAVYERINDDAGERFYQMFRPDPQADPDEYRHPHGFPRKGWWLSMDGATPEENKRRRLIALGFAEAMAATGDL